MIIKLIGEFNKRDKRGTVFLGTVETHEGLRRLGKKLHEGLRVVIWDGGLEAEGVLQKQGDVWRARILWETATHAGTPEPEAEER